MLKCAFRPKANGSLRVGQEERHLCLKGSERNECRMDPLLLKLVARLSVAEQSTHGAVDISAEELVQSLNSRRWKRAPKGCSERLQSDDELLRLVAEPAGTTIRVLGTNGVNLAGANQTTDASGQGFPLLEEHL
jgi:hypothetical protein